MSKLTIEQHIEVLYKCADSIDSEDGVVQQAIRESADVLKKRIEELEEENKRIPKLESLIEEQRANNIKHNTEKCLEISELEEANKHYKTGLEAIKNHIEIMTNNNSYKLNDTWNIANDYLKPITPTKGE